MLLGSNKCSLGDPGSGSGVVHHLGRLRKPLLRAGEHLSGNHMGLWGRLPGTSHWHLIANLLWMHPVHGSIARILLKQGACRCTRHHAGTTGRHGDLSVVGPHHNHLPGSALTWGKDHDWVAILIYSHTLRLHQGLWWVLVLRMRVREKGRTRTGHRQGTDWMLLMRTCVLILGVYGGLILDIIRRRLVEGVGWGRMNGGGGRRWGGDRSRRSGGRRRKLEGRRRGRRRS